MQRASTLIALIMVGTLWLFISPSPVPAGDLSETTALAQNPAASLRERLLAIDALGSSGDEGAAVPLLKILKNVSEEQGVRSSAARALARLGEPRTEILTAFESVYADSGSGENLLYTILLHFGVMRAVESIPAAVGCINRPEPHDPVQGRAGAGRN